MSDHQTETAQQRCPRDGQTAEWHLHVGGAHPSGSPRTNGEFIGCPFGSAQRTESDRLADAVRSLLRGASQSASYPATARVNAAALARVRVALATYDDLRNPPKQGATDV